MVMPAKFSDGFAQFFVGLMVHHALSKPEGNLP